MAQYNRIKGKSGNMITLMLDKGKCFIATKGRQLGQTIWKEQPKEVWDKALEYRKIQLHPSSDRK